MSKTGLQKVNLYLKKFLPQDQIVENFLEYLADSNVEQLKMILPKQGFFIGGPLSGSAPNEFTVATPVKGTDGQGHIMALDPTYAPTKFQNTLSIPYHVGARYNVLERGTEINVRTGRIEYSFFEDAIGEKGEPNLVVDNGSTLRVRVNSVTESGVSNAGRTAIIYLKTAVGQADAFYTGLVAWDGTNNYVDTTHLIGQTAGLVSTDPSDYWVFIPGVSVRRNTDLSLDSNYLYFGTVTGAGAGNTPSVFDDSDVVQHYSIDELTVAVNGILNDTAKEEWFEVTAPGGQSVFNASGISWSADHTIPDIQVYVNGDRVRQSPTGALDYDFRKVSGTQIEFAETLPQGAVVLIRDERTGGAGGSADLDSISTDPAPDVDGLRTLGTSAKGWDGLVLRDQGTGDKVKLTMVNGTLTFTII